MLEADHFQRTVVVEVDAAVVGISRHNWDEVQETTSADEAAAIMREKKYDVLPISGGGSVRSYFATSQWNDYERVEKQLIRHTDTVHYKTPIREIIRGFGSGERAYYFLANDREIVGLVSIVNLNCRQVKTYLYSLISELEASLADLLSAFTDEKSLKTYMFREPLPKKRADIKERYTKDVAQGVDAPFLEYLYLSDLIKAACKFGIPELLGYSKKTFDKKLHQVNDLRHAVAHPTRSLITDELPPKLLWERVDTIEEALFQINHLPGLETQPFHTQGGST